jgi:ribosome-binding factor A
MTSRRVQKVAEAIREVVSMAILTQVKDPRVQNVTVTYVEVSADLRQAKVHVSIMGEDSQQRLALSGLQSAAGFLQSRVADRIDTRYTPRLEFVLDLGVKKSIEVARILREVLPPEPSADPQTADPQTADPGAPADRGADEVDAGDELVDDAATGASDASHGES